MSLLQVGLLRVRALAVLLLALLQGPGPVLLRALLQVLPWPWAQARVEKGRERTGPPGLRAGGAPSPPERGGNGGRRPYP